MGFKKFYVNRFLENMSVFTLSGIYSIISQESCLVYGIFFKKNLIFEITLTTQLQ